MIIRQWKPEKDRQHGHHGKPTGADLSHDTILVSLLLWHFCPVGGDTWQSVKSIFSQSHGCKPTKVFTCSPPGLKLVTFNYQFRPDQTDNFSLANNARAKTCPTGPNKSANWFLSFVQSTLLYCSFQISTMHSKIGRNQSANHFHSLSQWLPGLEMDPKGVTIYNIVQLKHF